MKGYQVNNKLYVFPQEVGELPTIDSEVAVIYVQHEDLAAFKAANEAYTSMMVGYNYNVMTVKAKEWAGHTDDDIEGGEPEVTTYSITYEGDATEYVTAPESSAAGETVTIVPNEGYTFDAEQSETATVLGSRAFNASNEEVELEVTVDGENGTAYFTMPEYAVRATVNIDQDYQPSYPEEGTVFDFVGYADDSTSTPSSTGQITYEGEYSENTEFVYGTANVLFAGSGSPVETTVYMTKTDLIDALDGARVMVYSLDGSSLVGFGYGELLQLPTFETLNITQAQDYELSASVQTDTDWTGKTLYASVYDNDSNVLYLQLIPDGTDPTLLVLDTNYDGNIADETYLDSNSTGSVTVSNLAENRTYTCEYSWTNEAVVP